MHVMPLVVLVAFIATYGSCFVVVGSPFGPSAVKVHGSDVIVVGQPFTSTIVATDAVCSLGGYAGPCRHFRVAPPHSGVLRLGLHWTGGAHQLALVVTQQSSCCASPLFRSCAVTGGASYDVGVVMLPGAGGALPPDASQMFEVSATLE